MLMTSRLRSTTLTAHIAVSVGWIGALAGFLVLAVVGLTSQDAQIVRAAYLANGLITWYAIVPLAFASILTGIVQALGTPWGLWRHYWVLFKLVIVTIATIMLMGKTGAISHVADLAAEGTLAADDRLRLRYSIAVHAVGGLAILLWASALGVFKPRGLTGYGQRAEGHEAGPVAE